MFSLGMKMCIRDREALKKALQKVGVEPTEKLLARYSEINQAQWKKLELGELRYMGEVSVICHLPFGDISAFVNRYSSPRREWNVGMTSGWQ